VQGAATAPAPVASIDQQSLLARLERADSDMVLLDVRTAEEFAAGRVPGARNIAHDVLGDRLGELADARDREVVVYCRTGRRSQVALDVLRAAGFTRLAHLDGDWLGWEAAGRPVEKQTAATAPSAAPMSAPVHKP
jgi:rhodanese-related sulfurtransferase